MTKVRLITDGLGRINQSIVEEQLKQELDPIAQYIASLPHVKKTATEIKSILNLVGDKSGLYSEDFKSCQLKDTILWRLSIPFTLAQLLSKLKYDNSEEDNKKIACLCALDEEKLRYKVEWYCKNSKAIQNYLMEEEKVENLKAVAIKNKQLRSEIQIQNEKLGSQLIFYNMIQFVTCSLFLGLLIGIGVVTADTFVIPMVLIFLVGVVLQVLGTAYSMPSMDLDVPFNGSKDEVNLKNIYKEVLEAVNYEDVMYSDLNNSPENVSTIGIISPSDSSLLNNSDNTISEKSALQGGFPPNPNLTITAQNTSSNASNRNTLFQAPVGSSNDTASSPGNTI
ncbi:MAG: hypothetical protein ACHP6H_02620 [Legionellales bacterium]